MESRGTRLVLALTAGLAAAACGGSGDEATSPTPVSIGAGGPVATTTPTPAVPATATPTTPTTSTSTTASAPELGEPTADPAPPFVSTALEESPESQGWPLPAGPWQSSMFDPPLAFETTTELSLLSQSPEAIVLTEADADKDARLTILTPLAVGGDDNVPTAVPDDFEAYLRSVESIDIQAIRTFQRDDGAEMVMADFSAREPDGHTKFACSIGLDCLWLMKTSAGEDVHAIEGAPIRVIATTIDDVPIRIVASATDRDTFDRLATEAHRIAASFATTTDSPPENTPTFLSALGSRVRSIPPGSYVQRVGDQIIEFDVASELDGIALDHVGSNTILFDIGDIGYAYVLQPLGVVDPDVAQSVDGLTPTDLVDTPRTVADHEAWLSQILVVTGRSNSTIGGLPATSWTTVIDDSVDRYTCGPPMRATTGGECVTTFMTELGFWSSSGSDVGFDYFVDDTGIQVGGGPTDPDRIDEFEQAIAPLLDSIRFVT
jgi:hypothetical protein